MIRLIVPQPCDTAKTIGPALSGMLCLVIHVIVMWVQSCANKTGRW
ncbi:MULTISPECIES: hypothetical protein [unclassified Methylophilus]|nr:MULTISPECIES: hypothetical protein [unclassified Methylophilus]